MPMETVGTSINPVVPAGSKPADTVRKPPAVPQPEVSAIQPAQDYIKRNGDVAWKPPKYASRQLAELA